MDKSLFFHYNKKHWRLQKEQTAAVPGSQQGIKEVFMRKAGNFFKSIVPFLVAIVLQLAVSVPLYIIYTFLHAGDNGGGLTGIAGALDSAGSNTALVQIINLIYGILAVLVFVSWYRKVFVLPFRRKRKENPAALKPTGFSFHNILALFFLAIGLQYVTTFIVDIFARIHPAWLTAYQNLMDTAGYGSVSPVLVIYSVLLAPVVEETIFRGLIFRYARYALPFWIANIWQALLFGLLHMNILQGIYAFTTGLVLGFICHRGRGIRYSILMHIFFNIVGIFYSGLIEITTTLSYPIFTGLGIALTAFALWLFYTDFSR